MSAGVSIPESELRRLPYPALIYLAACCARRVELLFEQSWVDAPAAYVNAVRTAIVVAARSVTEPSPNDADRVELPVDEVAQKAAEAAMAADTSGAYPAAVYAADAAAELVHALDVTHDRLRAMRATCRVIRASALACSETSPEHEARLETEIKKDVRTLELHAMTERWTDDQQIPCVLELRP